MMSYALSSTDARQRRGSRQERVEYFAGDVALETTDPSYRIVAVNEDPDRTDRQLGSS